MAYHNSIGSVAEASACQYLQTQGLVLIKKNYRCFHGELDLIMRDKTTLVFIEVRQRSRIDFGSAIESVNAIKIRKLIKAASHFLQQQDWLNRVDSRFDIVAIHPMNGKMQIEWVKNAFLAGA